MTKKIWVYADIERNTVSDITLEILSKAQKLANQCNDATSVEVVLIGNFVEHLIPDLALAGADIVYLLEDPRLEFWSPSVYIPVLVELVSVYNPEVFLFGSTAQGENIGPGLAARLKTGMSAHCVDLQMDSHGMLVSYVPAFGGKVIGKILCPKTLPQMASIKPGVFINDKSTPKEERVVMFAPKSLDSIDFSKLKHVRNRYETISGVPITKAELVICGGAGLHCQEHWQMLERIAELSGGAIACTRPAVDLGWAQETSMVGTSGCNIRPELYIGFGISGATHHLCGINKAKYIVSINSDSEAPVFNVSDIKIVSDAGVILKKILEKLGS